MKDELFCPYFAFLFPTKKEKQASKFIEACPSESTLKGVKRYLRKP